MDQLARGQLLDDFGDTIWEAGPIPYGRLYASAGEPALVSLRDQAAAVEAPAEPAGGALAQGRAAAAYIFSDAPRVKASAGDGGTGGDGAAWSGDLFPHLPAWFDRGLPGVARFRRGTAQFFLGGEGAGAPLHYHANPAWNALVFGAKGWALFPPPNATFSAVPAAEALAAGALSGDAGALRCPAPPPVNCTPVCVPSVVRIEATCALSCLAALQWGRGYSRTALLHARHPAGRCVQRGGDVVLVPAWWGHATYTLAPSVGLAKEFHVDKVAGAGAKPRRNPLAVNEF